MLSTNDVYFHEKTQLGIITLNRPTALNALSHAMIHAIQEQLITWANNPDIKAIIITSSSEKAFCAGGDIRQIYHSQTHPDLSAPEFFADEYRLNHYIYHYPKPYIALLNGITMGGGAGISINGSHRVATENFLFAMPETSIGFSPDVGASFFLSRCPNPIGIYLGLTGNRIKAHDALALKLIDHVTTAQQLPMIIEALRVADFTADTAHNMVSDVIATFQQPPETSNLSQNYYHINECFSQQTLENILQQLASHALPWHQTTAEILKTKSPTSLKVALHALRQGALLNFDQCLQMEYRLVIRFLAAQDFYEGIRAVIIDKDQKPAWQPLTLEEISESDIASYFAPLLDIPELEFNTQDSS